MGSKTISNGTARDQAHGAFDRASTKAEPGTPVGWTPQPAIFDTPASQSFFSHRPLAARENEKRSGAK